MSDTLMLSIIACCAAVVIGMVVGYAMRDREDEKK